MESIKEMLSTIVGKVKELFAAFVNSAKANPKKFKLACGAILLVIVLIIGGSFAVSVATNNYKTPIKTMQKYANMKKYYDPVKESLAEANGLFADEIKAMAKLEKSKEDYKDDLEDAKDNFAERIENMQDEYGKNYKITYKVTDKEKIDKDDLKDYRDSLRDYAEQLEKMIDSTDDYDSEDWEDMADNLGFDGDKASAKKYVRILEDMRKELRSARVTAGYELEVTQKITGSELDEPEEEEMTITVYKVNGRWVSSSSVGLF